VQAQNQALKKWFEEVIERMEAVEVKRNIKQLSDSPHYVDLSDEKNRKCTVLPM